MPQNTENNDPGRYIAALLDVRRAYTNLPAECAAQIEEIKILINHNERKAAFILLETLQTMIRSICESALAYAEQNHGMKLERAITSRGEAEQVLDLALQNRDMETAGAARACVDGNNRWMALSIQDLER